jgi:hypothetical protein
VGIVSIFEHIKGKSGRFWIESGIMYRGRFGRNSGAVWMVGFPVVTPVVIGITIYDITTPKMGQKHTFNAHFVPVTNMNTFVHPGTTTGSKRPKMGHLDAGTLFPWLMVPKPASP